MKYNSVAALERAGIKTNDAMSLRRISMTLHRWHEMECGGDSCCIVRGRMVNGGFVYGDKGHAYLEFAGGKGAGRYRRIPDRETGALKRLKSIMKRYPKHIDYVQGDPRGAALYIIPRERLLADDRLDSVYTRGIAVCQ